MSSMMSRTEVPRAGLLKAALAGRITNAQGARALRLSVRQFRRLKKRFRERGARGLLHALRGRPGNRQLVNEDLFVTDVGDATVVTLFLPPEMNLAVRPKLQRELKRGTRIVSHWHDMGDWKPQETVRVRSGGRESPIFLWTVLDR